MKRVIQIRIPGHGTVAPHAGAWIETVINPKLIRTTVVAPHAGAWIETFFHMIVSECSQVAPHAGAWIETTYSLSNQPG